MFAWKNSFAQMQMVRQPGFKRTFSGEDSEKKAKNLHSIFMPQSSILNLFVDRNYKSEY